MRTLRDAIHAGAGSAVSIEDMEADLSRIVVERRIGHAENILVLLRQHEAAGIDHDTSIHIIYSTFVQEVRQ